MNSEELFELSKKYVPGGVHSPVRSFKGLHTTPRFINRVDKAYLYDEEGKDYIDFCMSFGPMILGHRNPVVEEAIKESLTRGWSFGACEKYSTELAKFIVDRIPFIDQIRFVSSGTEAVMSAIRLMRGFTKKDKIIKFDGCYHGHTDSMLIKAGSGLAQMSEASSAGVSQAQAMDTIVLELGDRQGVVNAFTEYKDQIAGILVEPLPANNGLLIQEVDFLKFLREECTKNNSLLLFDEVISGFRVAFGGMAEVTGITPDIVTYGKIIGGGMPVGALAAKKEIMQCLAPVGSVYQAGTLSANPVAMCAGLATLKQLDADFYSKLAEQTEKITSMLSEWMQTHEMQDYQLIKYGSLFWNVPTQENVTKASQIPTQLPERFYTLFEQLLNKGVYLAPNAYEVGFVSIAHDDEVLSDLKQRLWS